MFLCNKRRMFPFTNCGYEIGGTWVEGVQWAALIERAIRSVSFVYSVSRRFFIAFE